MRTLLLAGWIFVCHVATASERVLDGTADLAHLSQEQQDRLEIKKAAVLSYLNATTREAALAHLAPDYRIRFGTDEGEGMSKEQVAEMLLWDYALRPVHDIERFEVVDGNVVVRHQEMNDFAMLINFPGWNATSTYVVNDDGLIAEQRYVPSTDRPGWKIYLEKALPWLREHRADTLARIYPSGRLKQDAGAAREWVEVLCEWRAATKQYLPDVCQSGAAAASAADY